jgi:alpha-1,4-digalacturonate transport system permease protein
MFILPNLVAVALFSLWPMVNGLRESFYSTVQGQAAEGVGLHNYGQLVTSSDFWSAVRNTLEFVVGYVALTMVLSTVLALLLNAQRWARGLFRAAVYIPVLISPIVVGVLWKWLLQPDSGVIDALLVKAGLGQPGWLVDPRLAMVSAVVVELWATVGFYTLIVLGGLQSIDPAMFEAARVDGASEWRQIRKITLPSLRPTLLIVLILSTITGFQAFEFLYSLTGGGPVGATTLIVQYIYNHAFVQPINLGLATAASALLFVVLLVLTLINLIVARRRGDA